MSRQRTGAEVTTLVRRAPSHARTSPGGFGRIARISSSLVGTQALTSVLGLLYWTLAARLFPVGEVGVAAAAVATMMLLGSLGSLGFGTLLIARLPRTPQGDRRLLIRTCLVTVGLAGAGLALTLTLAAVHLGGADNLRPLVATPLVAVGLAVGTGLLSVTLVLDQAVLTVGNGGLQLERNVLASVVKIVALIALAGAGATGGMSIFLAWTIGSALSLPLVAWRTRGGRALQNTRRVVAPAVLKGLARLAASHHALNIALQAPLQLLPILVTVLLSAQANGYFNAALLVTGFVFALPYAIAISLFASADGDADAVVARMGRTIGFGIAASVAAYAVLYPLAGVILRAFGENYSDESTTILRLLALAGVAFVVKDHFIALRRVQDRTTGAVSVVGVFLVVELVAAALGARLGGVVGLCTAWVGVLYLEALILGVVLVRTIRARNPPTGAQNMTATPTQGARPAGPVAATSSAVPPAAAAAAVPAVPAVPPAAAVSPTAAANGRVPDLTGPILLVMACGVLVMALAAAGARTVGGTGATNPVLWNVGLAVVFAAPAWRILVRRTSTRERVVLAVALPVVLQLSRLVLNPTRFAFHDELIHATTLRQIGQSSGLFSTNSLLPVSGYYPGMEIVTDAVHRLSGLSPFVAATVVEVAARVVLAVGVLVLAARVTRSARVGAIAVLLYTLNSQFLFFNSQFSYQTLALPLAVLVVYLFVTRSRGTPSALVAPLVATGAVALTHHVTSMLLTLALAGWLLVEVVLPRARRDVGALATMTAASALAVVVLALNPGSPVRAYLDAIATSSSQQISALTGGAPPKAVFANSAGLGPTPPEQVLLIAAVLGSALSLLIAVVFLRRSVQRRHVLGVVVAAVALLYPVIPGGHLTRATAEVGDRAAGFVFLGVAIVTAWWLAPRLRGAWAAAGAALALTVVFLGNVVLGSGPTSVQLPGPYLIAADQRSVDADNVAAARWLGANVPADTRVYGDRISGLLAASDGGQFTVRNVSTDIDASRLILDPQYTPADVTLIRRAEIAYVIVDQRLADGLPNEEVYIENGEFGGEDRTEAVPRSALTKFDDVPGATRVYDNGSLLIYDVKEIRDGD